MAEANATMARTLAMLSHVRHDRKGQRALLRDRVLRVLVIRSKSTRWPSARESRFACAPAGRTIPPRRRRRRRRMTVSRN